MDARPNPAFRQQLRAASMMGRGPNLPWAECQACHSPWHQWNDRGGANPFPSPCLPAARGSAAARASRWHGTAGKPIPHPRGVGAEPPAPTINYSYENQGERQYWGSAPTQPAARRGAGSNLGAGGCPLGSCMNSEGGGGRGLILLQHQEQAGNRSPMKKAVEERGTSHCSGTPSRRTLHGTARGSHRPTEHHPGGKRGHPASYPASTRVPSRHGAGFRGSPGVTAGVGPRQPR